MIPWRWTVASVVLVTLLAFANGEAEAQACLLSGDELSGWGALHVGQTGTSHALVAAELGWQAHPRWAVSGQAEAARFTTRDPERWTGRIKVFLGLPLSTACLTASVEHDRLVDTRVTSVPFGLLIGTNLGSSASSWQLTPFIEPRAAYRRSTIPGWLNNSAAYSVIGGALVGMGRLFLDLRYQKVFDHEAASSVRLRLGTRF